MPGNDFSAGPGVKKEATGKRDLKYSGWHRTLSAACLATDLDFVEVRGGQIKALIETKRLQGEIKFFQRKTFLLIGEALGIPVYGVYHNLETEANKDLWVFCVHDLKADTYKTLGEVQYRQFLETL